MSGWTVAWLAGIFEGEGSFSIGTNRSGSKSITARLAMTDEDVVQRVADLLGRPVYRRKTYAPHHKDSYRVAICGAPAASFMEAIRPYMGERRQGQIDQCLAAYSGSRRLLTDEQASEIRHRADAGERVTDLAREFGVNRPVVNHIKHRRTYVRPNTWGVPA